MGFIAEFDMWNSKSLGKSGFNAGPGHSIHENIPALGGSDFCDVITCICDGDLKPWSPLVSYFI